jgi:hypothetical protein
LFLTDATSRWEIHQTSCPSVSRSWFVPPLANQGLIYQGRFGRFSIHCGKRSMAALAFPGCPTIGSDQKGEASADVLSPKSYCG